MKRQKSTMASLPEDIIIMGILTILPVKSISRFRCVCKLWNELFKTPKFIKMHHNHAIQNNKFSVLIASYKEPFMFPQKDGYYTIDFDATSSSYLMPVQKHLPFLPESVIIRSCDGGLIASATGNHMGPTRSMICLWNPSTQDYKKISISSTFGNDIHKVWSRYGVCYDWKIDDYKLFLIVAKWGNNICSEVWVSRLGSNSWNSIGNIPYNIWHAKVSVKPLNGIIHWIGKAKIIVSFDIVEVRTKDIPTPSCYLEDELYSYEDMVVHVLGEDLYLSVNDTYKKRNIIDLWVMKNYGGIDSWTKNFSLSKDKTTFDTLRPLHYLNKNREILLHGVVNREGETSKKKVGREGKDSSEDVLVSYDPKSGRLDILDIPGIPRPFYVTPFVGSLVSLDSGKLDVISKVDTR